MENLELAYALTNQFLFQEAKNNITDINKVDEYIKNHCAYDCRYFILKKI